MQISRPCRLCLNVPSAACLLPAGGDTRTGPSPASCKLIWGLVDPHKEQQLLHLSGQIKELNPQIDVAMK